MALSSSSVTSATLQRVVRAMERIAPISLADRSWDNTGVLVGRKVLLTIDLTPRVADELFNTPALSDVACVVAYHPVIFRGLKSITTFDPLQTVIMRCVANGVSVYSPHTSLDAAVGGINDWLARGIVGDGEKEETSAPIVPVSAPAPEGHEKGGMGRTVRLSKPVELDEIVRRVKSHLKLKYVQLATPTPRRPIQTVGICAGSGGSVLNGRAGKVDLFLTGELSHHETLAAIAKGTSVLLTNHSNSERGFLRDVLQPRLTKELAEEQGQEQGDAFEVFVSEADRDPLEVV